jgi:hypothetical protein
MYRIIVAATLPVKISARAPLVTTQSTVQDSDPSRQGALRVHFPKAWPMIVLLSILCVPLNRAHGDHLPEGLIAKGKPEHMLCGIDVYKTNFKGAEATLGSPSYSSDIKVTYFPKGWGFRLHVWNIHMASLFAYSSYRSQQDPAEDQMYEVEIYGLAPSGIFGRTGAGLSLGCDLACVERIYGSRFYRQSPHDILLEFSDGTQLTVGFDSGGKIYHMMLVAEVE